MKTATNTESHHKKTGNKSMMVESFKPDFENPGVFPYVEANRIVNEKLSGIWYINQIAVVHSLQDSYELRQEIEKRQREWFRHLTKQFKNGWRRLRNSRETSRWQRGYEYDGVIIFNNTILPYESWKLVRKPLLPWLINQ